MADHETDPDTPDECPWDLGVLRDRVAGLGKSLIQARLSTEPDFLPASELARWGLTGAARPSLGAVAGLLMKAVQNLRWLRRRGFLPEFWRCSKVPLSGPDCVDRLSDLVEVLLLPADGDDPVAKLATAIGPSPSRDWVRWVDWEAMAEIRTLIDDHFPPVPRRPPSLRPSWFPHEGRLMVGDQLVCPVGAQADVLRSVLDAFEAAEWAESIPAPTDYSTKQLRDCLTAFHRRSSSIRFRLADRGRTVNWERIASFRPSPRI